MFGTYRALLALRVVLLRYAKIPYIGQYAVFGYCFLIYLVHYPLAFLFLYFFRLVGIDLTRPSPTLFSIAIPFLIAAEWGMAVSIERRVELPRAAVKQRLGA